MRSFDYSRTFQRWDSAINFAWAADCLIKSWGDIGLTNPAQVDVVMAHLVSLLRYVDDCPQCTPNVENAYDWRNRGTIPHRAEVDGDRMVAHYLCPRGHGMWTCGWRVPEEEHEPSKVMMTK